MRQREAEALAEQAEQAERERAAIAAALERALNNVAGQHAAEIEKLRAQLAEAEVKSIRAVSLAQMTRAGHVYVISNLGSFGPNVFKIGMTRREEPMDRVDELGDASVPFPFDVHMMIKCDDAPRLEAALHPGAGGSLELPSPPYRPNWRATGVRFARRCYSCLGNGYLNEMDQTRRVRWRAGSG